MAITYPFPYITSIHVNNCYAYQDFDIVLNDHHKPFSHLVLTGKNGSGKSTILKGLHDFLYSTRRNPLGHLTAYHHQFTVNLFKLISFPIK
jgi:ABC-type molybdenum transport system ATPase subunit/photorepair protein PhrA